ncbi:MAG: hypothetical protein JW797_13005 [Bradymonadales bacterium]|nr:hypothetical protein [Bradymonadales bacterium]
MKRVPSVVFALCVIALLGWLRPSPVQAGAFAVWVGGRGDYFSGSSDLFTEFDNSFGGALEAGLELFYVTTFLEAVMLGQDQFLFTLDAGVDLDFGEKPRFMVGLYTGPILFLFPESTGPTGVDFSSLSSNELQALLTATGTSDRAELEQQFNTYVEEEEELGSLGFGWNLARLRLSVDFPLVKTLYLGIAGQVGYHMLISGEDVAAGAKNQVVDHYAEQYDIPAALVDRLREVVGARPVDREHLDGFNWDVNLYLRLEFGSR